MRICPVVDNKSGTCRDILDDLPEWFGLPEAKAAYVLAAAALPMLGGSIDGQTVAFVSLKAHTAFATEMFVLGVKRRWHGQGLGRSLVTAALDHARREGTRFLTVKTLAASHPDRHYAATRGFYEALGFVPLEVFPELWAPETPCLFMLRAV